MELLPAIDVRGGRCVRLYQGDYRREKVYDADPVRVAVGFAEEGARWLHLVDLDGARAGVPENVDVVAAVAAAVTPHVSVQVGGGVRDRACAERLMAAGATRVVVGTIAAEVPDLVQSLAAELPVVVSVDARDGQVAVRGWTAASGQGMSAMLASYSTTPLAAVVVTEIGRDGTLTGPDLEALGAALASTSVDVIASGGVSSLADLEALRRLELDGRRLAGVIVGTALYEGRFSVREAIAACAASA